MKKKFKKNIHFLILLPIILNYLNNLIYGNNTFNLLNFYDFFSSILIFSFFYLIGLNFKLINKNFSITLGIISFLFSFYLFEMIVLFFYDNVNLDFSFYICSFIWFIYFLISLKNKIFAFFPIFLYFLMNIYNSYFFELMSKDINITMDVLNVFFPNTQNIYDNSLKYSVSNPIMEGYPQFMSFIDALIFKFSFNLSEYRFLISTTFLFYWLHLLLIFELKISNKNKIFGALFFSILIFNSSWLQFLFTSSLMSERVAGYLLLGILSALFRIENPTRFEIGYIFITLGFVYLTKQFFSILVLIIFLLFLFNKKYIKFSLLILIPYFLNTIAYRTYFSSIPREHHLRQIDIKDTVIDLVLLRDLQIGNIIEILKNLYIDKPMTYTILIAFISLFYIFFKHKTDHETVIYSIITLLNILFIFLLYISAWRNMELESPIRYMYSFLIFYLTLIIKSLDSQIEINH